MRSLKKLPQISDVGAGNSITIRVPVGKTIDRIFLNYANVTLAQMKNIRLELNGNLHSEYKTAEDLQKFSVDYFQRNNETDRLVFDFNQDDVLKTVEEGRFFGLGTAGLSTVTITMDIDAAATGVTLEAYAETSAPTPPGWLSKFRNWNFSASAAGILEIDSLPKPAGASIARIHVVSAAAINSAVFEIDGTKWIDAPKSVIDGQLKDYGRTPQAGALTLDFVLQGDIKHAVPMLDGKTIQDMRLKLDMAEAGQVTIYVEYIDQWTPNGF
ncbi:hypothetical protein AAOGI_06830 [Agarivorans albus]